MPEAPAAPPTIPSPEPPPAPAPAPAPTPPADPPSNDGSPVYAGKFKGPVALEKGYRELARKLELAVPEEGKALFGPGAPFTDVMALEASYQNFEKLAGKIGSAKPPEAPAPAPKPSEMPTIPDPAAAKPPVGDEDPDFEAIAAKAGLKASELAAKFQKQQHLDDTDYAALKGVGFGRKLVDGFIDGAIIAQKALVRDTMADILTLTGGEQQLQTLTTWAGTAYQGAELADMQAGIKDPRRAVDITKKIMFDYQRQGGHSLARPTVDGTGGVTVGTGAYTDPNEYRAVLDKMNRGLATDAEKARFVQTDKKILLK